MELSRHVLDGWRHISKRRIIFIQKFMVETFVDNSSRTRLDLTDINQHSSDRINRAGKNKIGGVVAPGSIARLCLRTECHHVFAISPTRNKQTARGREFKALANRQEHDAAPAIFYGARKIRGAWW